MQLMTRLEDLLHVTPGAVARTGASCVLAPYRDRATFPMWVNARDHRGALVAVVRVHDISEAFVVVAKLLSVITPPEGGTLGTVLRGPEIELACAAAGVELASADLVRVAA